MVSSAADGVKGKPAAAERFAASAPYVKNGLIRRWRVRPWTAVVGKDAAAPARPGGE